MAHARAEQAPNEERSVNLASISLLDVYVRALGSPMNHFDLEQAPSLYDEDTLRSKARQAITEKAREVTGFLNIAQLEATGLLPDENGVFVTETHDELVARSQKVIPAEKVAIRNPAGNLGPEFPIGKDQVLTTERPIPLRDEQLAAALDYVRLLRAPNPAGFSIDLSNVENLRNVPRNILAQILREINEVLTTLPAVNKYLHSRFQNNENSAEIAAALQAIHAYVQQLQLESLMLEKEMESTFTHIDPARTGAVEATDPSGIKTDKAGPFDLGRSMRGVLRPAASLIAAAGVAYLSQAPQSAGAQSESSMTNPSITSAADSERRLNVASTGFSFDPRKLLELLSQSNTGPTSPDATASSASLDALPTKGAEQESGETLPNFQMTDLPLARELSNDYRVKIGPAYQHMPDQFPGTKVIPYAEQPNNVFYYKFILNDAAQFGSYGPDFDKKLAAAKQYADGINAKAPASGKAAAVVLFYSDDAITIGIQTIKEIPNPTTTDGKQSGNLLPGSLIFIDANNNFIVAPTEDPNEQQVTIGGNDYVNSLKAAGLLAPGQQTVTIADGKIVKIDDLLKPYFRLVVTLSMVKGQQVISHIYPAGKPIPTSTPVSGPAGIFRPVELTISTNGEVELPQEYVQAQLSPEDLAQLGTLIPLDTGTKFTLTIGPNSIDYFLTLGGMTGATNLYEMRDIKALFDIVHFNPDFLQGPQEVQIIIVPTANDIATTAKKLGLTLNAHEIDNLPGDIPGIRTAFSTEPVVTADKKYSRYVNYMFVTKPYLDLHYGKRSDASGQAIPLSKTIKEFLTEEFIVGLQKRHDIIEDPKQGATDGPLTSFHNEFITAFPRQPVAFSVTLNANTKQ